VEHLIPFLSEGAGPDAPPHLLGAIAGLEIERIRQMRLPDPTVVASYRTGLDAARRHVASVWDRFADHRVSLLTAAALFGGCIRSAHRLHWVFERPRCPRCDAPFPPRRTAAFDPPALLAAVEAGALDEPSLIALARTVDDEVAGLLGALDDGTPCPSCEARLPDVPLPERFWTRDEVRARARAFGDDTTPLALWTARTVLGETGIRDDPVLAERIRRLVHAGPPKTRSRALQVLQEARVAGLAGLARRRLQVESDAHVQKQLVLLLSEEDDFDALEVALDREGLLGVFATLTLGRRLEDLPAALARSTLLRIAALCGSDAEDPTTPSWEVVQRGVRSVPLSSPHYIGNQAVETLLTAPPELLQRFATHWDDVFRGPSPPLEGWVVLGALLGGKRFDEALQRLRQTGRSLARPGIGPFLESRGAL
jgi:hypothetical protein